MGSYVLNPEAPRVPQQFHSQILKASTGIYKNLLASAYEPSLVSWPAPGSRASDTGSLVLGQSTASPRITGRYISPCLSPPKCVPASQSAVTVL